MAPSGLLMLTSQTDNTINKKRLWHYMTDSKGGCISHASDRSGDRCITVTAVLGGSHSWTLHRCPLICIQRWKELALKQWDSLIWPLLAPPGDIPYDSELWPAPEPRRETCGLTDGNITFRLLISTEDTESTGLMGTDDQNKPPHNL